MRSAAVAVVLLVSAASGSAGDPASVGRGQRSVEILRVECRNDLARRGITLFANGTVRLREGPWDDQSLALDELTPGEMQEILEALGGVDIESPAAPPSVDGRWSEDCRASLALPDRPAWSVRYSAWAVPPVAVSRIVQVAEDLALEALPPATGPGLPAGYGPRPGDVLETGDGGRWRVLRYTGDRRGIELESLGQPLRIFVDLGAVQERFVRLVERRGR